MEKCFTKHCFVVLAETLYNVLMIMKDAFTVRRRLLRVTTVKYPDCLSHDWMYDLYSWNCSNMYPNSAEDEVQKVG